MQNHPSRIIKFSDLVIAPNEYLVSRDGNAIPLPKLSFELLIFFIEHPNQVYSIEQIASIVWQHTIVSNDTVVQRVTLLRKALGDDAKSPRYIESVRGRGYKLVGLPEDVEIPLDEPAQNLFSNMLTKKLAMVMIISVVTLGLVYWFTPINAPFELPAANQQNKEVDTLIHRAHYYYDIGQSNNLALSVDLYQQALAINPNHPGALTGLSLALSKSVCRYRQNVQRANQAKNLAQKVIAITPQSSEGYNALAYAWDCLGNLELALANYNKAIDLAPSNASSIGSAAYLYAIKGDLLAAYDLSSQVLVLDPQAYMASLQIAHVLSLMKLQEYAKPNFSELFSLYPDNVFVNLAYPTSLYEQGKLANAEASILKSISRGVERADIYVLLGEVTWLLHDKQRALTFFQQAATLDEMSGYSNTTLELIQNTMQPNIAKHRIDLLLTHVNQGNTWPINYIEAALISLWALNDKEQSLHFLSKAHELGYLRSDYLKVSPWFAPLRNSSQDHAVAYQNIIDEIDTKRITLKQSFVRQYPQYIN